MAMLLMVRLRVIFNGGRMGHWCSKLVLVASRNSPGVLNFYNVTLQRYFSHPSLVIPTSLITQIGGGVGEKEVEDY
jgi:hypothetical protein